MRLLGLFGNKAAFGYFKTYADKLAPLKCQLWEY